MPAYPDLQGRTTRVWLTLPVLLALLGMLPRSTAAQDAYPAKAWNMDIGATGVVSPGIGDAAAAIGAAGTLAIVHSTVGSTSHDCIGIVAVFLGTWARSTTQVEAHSERWVGVGPRWDRGEDAGTVFLHALIGTKFSSASSSTNPDGAAHLALGAGAGLAYGKVQILEVNWLVSPGDPLSRYRLALSSGFVFSSRLSPRR